MIQVCNKNEHDTKTWPQFELHTFCDVNKLAVVYFLSAFYENCLWINKATLAHELLWWLLHLDTLEIRAWRYFRYRGCTFG